MICPQGQVIQVSETLLLKADTPDARRLYQPSSFLAAIQEDVQHLADEAGVPPSVLS